jgi:hypothetical protein
MPLDTSQGRINKYRWLLVVTSLVWIALVRFVYRQGGNQGLIIVGVLTALLVITALILPWIGRLKVVLVVKGSFILLWRKVRSLANVAESAAREESKKE